MQPESSCFDGHNYHYNDDIMSSNFIHTSTLKSGDIKNDHNDDNRPNSAIKLI